MRRKDCTVALVLVVICCIQDVKKSGSIVFVNAFVVPTTTRCHNRAVSPASPWLVDSTLRLFSSPRGDESSATTIDERSSSGDDEILDFDGMFPNFGDINKDGIVSDSMTSLAEVLNNSTDGWALTYADLHPETESTPAGIGFLATNLAYGLAGLVLAFQGDFFYGVLTDLAALVSFWYHFTQLKFGRDKAAIVRLALLMDYIVASATILTTAWYLSTGHTLEFIPPEGIAAGVLGTASLGLCWVWEYGYPYMILHSMWHLLSAYAGYIVGQAHLQSIA